MLRFASKIKRGPSLALALSSRGFAGAPEPIAVPTVRLATAQGRLSAGRPTRSSPAPAAVHCAPFPDLSALQSTVKLLIDGQFVESKTSEWVDVKNPATQARKPARSLREHLSRKPAAAQRHAAPRARLWARAFAAHLSGASTCRLCPRHIAAPAFRRKWCPACRCAPQRSSTPRYSLARTRSPSGGPPLCRSAPASC
jgi:hypothetical protein